MNKGNTEKLKRRISIHTLLFCAMREYILWDFHSKEKKIYNLINFKSLLCSSCLYVYVNIICEMNCTT